jgi:hypothetical protein
MRAEGEPDGTCYLLKASVLAGSGTRFERMDPTPGRVLLVGSSGPSYLPTRNGDQMGWSSWYIRARFVVPEPVVKARFEVTARMGMYVAGSFRLTDLPLPRRAVFVPGRPAREGAPGIGSFRAFHQAGGAALALPVLLREAPAPPGLLRVGLSRQLPSGWSPVRWLDVEVVDGKAHLVDLQPGTYRLLRSYVPDRAPEEREPGAWSGSDLQLSLAAGKQTVAPPLQWRPPR